MLLLFSISLARAQENRPRQTDDSFAFDVISVRPERNQESASYRLDFRGETFEGKSVTVLQLVEYAYSIPLYRIDWNRVHKDETCYAVRAKISPELAAHLSQLDDEEKFRIQRRLVQKLLKERFGLAAHEELKNKLAYSLSIGKTGAKIEPANDPRIYKPEELKDAKPQTIIHGKGSLQAEALTMNALAEYLSDELGSPVADKTGLSGSFRFSLK